ncbi:hypothetical protein B0H66DRAFT_592577 [Apodospora peruviana]|uniref:Uncharacterized protein n=1 Tax=Apodospora peruviana TaxID=516989 RepID=A0AAE0I0P9_9PEZI|nr:hypothetical protein B0H66DRAFT_592577 [Apodospora peruviana]
MQSLFTVNNNVSLLSVTIAPSAWVASLVLSLVFLFLYLPPLPSIIRPRNLFRRSNRKQVASYWASAPGRHIYEEDEDTDDDYYSDRRPSQKQQRRIIDKPLPALIQYPWGDDEDRKHPERERRSSSRNKQQQRKRISASGPLDPLEHLDASLEDFEPSIGSSRSPTTATKPFSYHPSNHSGGFREDEDDLTSSGDEMMEEEIDENDSVSEEASAGGYSPPAWRRLGNGDRSSGFWRAKNNLSRNQDDLIAGLGVNGRTDGWSRESSPEYEYESADEGDKILAQAARTRLPAGSVSPDKERSPEPEFYPVQQHLIDETLKTVKMELGLGQGDALAALDDFKSTPTGWKEEPVSDNYFRFGIRAEVQQRTEPIETAINFFRTRMGFVFRSWASMVGSAVVAFMAYAAVRSLFQPAAMRPVPDLVKVAGVARAFEPLIYYSENGVQQVGDLQATGVAVWDLGESVRSSNMTSAPIIVKELDELSDSLKTLAIELTKFFANVDGDIDGILIVMDWARRELSQLQQLPSPPLSSAFDNIHNMLSNAGILENPSTGQPTRLGSIMTSIFGPSNPQRTKQTLQRTFNEFLAVLEEAINNELSHSLALFALFEAIDQQFLNLARTVVRESSLQEEHHAELLSSLWTRILGARASDVKKYERNRLLLLNVREKTVRNKGVLVEHNHKLLALKASLENLRRKLVSPLVRSVNSSTLTIDEQIKGLEDVGQFLDGVRTRQKSKLMDILYGSTGSQRVATTLDGGNGRLISGDS